MQALGYATKFYPLPVQHALEEVATIFCDDDQVYDPNLANRLINAAQKYLIARL